MIKSTVLAAVFSNWASVVAADELSIMVDEPIVCLTIESMLDVDRYYRKGGFELANAWAEYSSDCVRLGPTEVPVELTKGFISFAEGIDLKYGYIPIGVGRVTFFYLYFMTIKGKGIPA